MYGIIKTLRYQKICCHWVPWLLTEEYKRACMNVSLQLFQSHAADSDDFVTNSQWRDTSFFNTIMHAITLHTSHQRKLKSLGVKCFPILLTGWTWPIQTTAYSGPSEFVWGASTTKTMRQSTKPHVHGSEILKLTSTTAVYSSSCSTGGDAWIILGNSWNSDATSPLTQDGICFVHVPLF
jgi:hypothetical protein